MRGSETPSYTGHCFYVVLKPPVMQDIVFYLVLTPPVLRNIVFT